MNIIFETSDVWALDKPALMLTVPSRMGKMDPRPCLGILLQEHFGKPIFPVHRLDFEVSGLVLFAKNPQAHRTLNAWFEGHFVKKEYEARTQGKAITHDWQTWTSRLVRGKKRTFEAAHGQEAITLARFKGLDSDERLMWELRPKTGRPHQLRVELAKHGFPIVGDQLYGSTVTWPKGGIALRSVELNFSDCPEAKTMGLPDRLRLQGF